MRLTLKPHPDWPPQAATKIEVEVSRARGGALELLYRLTGIIDHIEMPPVAAPARADGLWQHSCFEAFLRGSPDPAYYEFNFAPSGQWAAYRFDAYREGMEAAEIGSLAIAACSGPELYELRAALDLTPLPGLPLDEPWSLGLSAVIEEKGGRKSYWAVSHPPGKADFHHNDCFAYQLSSAGSL